MVATSGDWKLATDRMDSNCACGHGAYQRFPEL